MKVAHIINSMFTGGAENLIVESVSVFQKKDFLVDVILLNGSQTPFLNKLKATKCSVFSLSTSSVYNPFLIFKIIPFLRKYQVIHVHLFPALYWVAIAKLVTFSKVKLVYTEHGTSNRRMNSKFFAPIDRFIYSFYDKIITISDDVDLAIKNVLKCDYNKFELIKNGINLDKIKSATPYFEGVFAKPFCEKFLFQFSSFQYPKDQKTVIKSLLHLPQNVQLFLVGDGILKSECETFVKSLNLQNRVHFLGIRMDVPNLLKTADIIVLSSHHEGLSLASIEGLASEKPFVCSNVPGLREVVSGAGLLFEDKNERSLSEIVINLLENETYYNQTVMKCLERAKTFDIDSMIEKEINLYKKLHS